MSINRTFKCNPGNYVRGGNSCRYIVVHNTGGDGSAREEASYANKDAHGTSWHYVLDGVECYQIMDDTDTAWAVGCKGWRNAKPIIRNSESISVEVCSNGTSFTTAEQVMLRDVVRMLMSRHGIPASRVVRHYDCHTGRKECPAFYSGRNNAAWSQLHAYITADDASIEQGETMTPFDVWNYNNGHDTDAYGMLTSVYNRSFPSMPTTALLITPTHDGEPLGFLAFYDGHELHGLDQQDQPTSVQKVYAEMGQTVKSVYMEDNWFYRFATAVGCKDEDIMARVREYFPNENR